MDTTTASASGASFLSTQAGVILVTALAIAIILFIGWHSIRAMFTKYQDKTSLGMRVIGSSVLTIEDIKDTNYSHECLAKPPTVDFDPSDSEHLLAFELLRSHGRQHPTLRFNYNGFKHDNVYAHMIEAVLSHATIKASPIADDYACAKHLEALSYAYTQALAEEGERELLRLRGERNNEEYDEDDDDDHRGTPLFSSNYVNALARWAAKATGERIAAFASTPPTETHSTQ